jgi:lipoprotein-releasing system ATP-binding protein
MDEILKANKLCYGYCQENERIPILKDFNFSLYAKQKICLIGASGIGKSTLLHLLGLLDVPQSGEILLLDNQKIVTTYGMSDKQRTKLRRHFIGIIYQFHYLLSEFTALENVMIPQMIAGKSKKNASERGHYLLHLVGLEKRYHHRPSQLSGGQQQRVAIARALANEPRILLADEPTGNVDEHTAQEILQLFFTLSQEHNLSILMATHNLALCPQFDQIISLNEGQLVYIAKDSLHTFFNH